MNLTLTLIQVLCQTLRARRSLNQEAVDIYLHLARERLKEIDTFKATTEKGGETVMALPIERLMQWTGTVHDTNPF
jgi:hypothetical protein